MAAMAALRHLFGALFVAGLLAQAAASAYDEQHVASYDHALSGSPRKAMLLKDVSAAKSATLKVSVTLEDGASSCPSQPSDMEGMRRFVADAFDTLLRQAHVDAKLKTGTVGCQVNFEDDCTKIIMQFVVKLTPRKGCEKFPKFIQGLAASLYLDKPICDVHEVGCHAHGVAKIEVVQMARKPHGTRLVKYSPADEDSEDEGEAEASFHSSWSLKTRSSRKADRAQKHAAAGTTDDADEDSEGAASGDEGDSNSGGAYGGSGYSAGGAAVTAAAAPQEHRFKIDTRLWPDQQLPAIYSGAATAAAAEVAAAAAVEPAEHKTAGIDMRLWPDYHGAPWEDRAAPLQ